jgi:hypothetical protein
MGAEKRDRRRETDHVLFLVVVELLAIFCTDQASGDDRRGSIQAGVIAHVFERVSILMY